MLALVLRSFDQRQTFQCQRTRIKPIQKADMPQ
jgi:hypothetical protein